VTDWIPKFSEKGNFWTYNKPPKITPDEELELARRHRDQGDKKALESLMFHNIYLVLAIAYPYRWRSRSAFDDLVQAGFDGLASAALKFDPDKGVQFGTYAQHRIRGSIIDQIWKDIHKQPKTTRKIIEEIRVLIDKYYIYLRTPFNELSIDSLSVEIHKIQEKIEGVTNYECKQVLEYVISEMGAGIASEKMAFTIDEIKLDIRRATHRHHGYSNLGQAQFIKEV
jgi:RNA polymerase sigma factor (sigma-70 family)